MKALNNPQHIHKMCPNCLSIETEGYEIDTYEVNAYQGMACLQCKTTWRNVYALVKQDCVQTWEC